MQNIPIKRIKANGIQFAYFEKGEGPLMLVLHGFPDTPHSFLPLMNIFAEQGYRVVAPFMRGYFPTSRSTEGDYSVLGLANDVISIIDALAITEEKAIVVGHDWGALAAYVAANLAPEKISALIQMSVPHMHVSNFTWAQVRRSWYVWFFQIPWLPEKRLPNNNFGFIDKLYSAWSPNWDYPPERLDEIKKALAVEGGVKAALAYYRAMIRGMTMQQMRFMQQQTTVPTLLIAGEADGSVGIEQFKNMSRAYTDFFRFMSYPNIGHFPHNENCDTLAADILEFIKQCHL
jgi:pimeloyl-ACP methyl ester carboxylesterase